MSNTCGTAQQLSCGSYELLCSEDMVFAIERSAQKDEKHVQSWISRQIILLYSWSCIWRHDISNGIRSRRIKKQWLPWISRLISFCKFDPALNFRD
jgi:hypothetical protein